MQYHNINNRVNKQIIVNDGVLEKLESLFKTQNSKFIYNV